MQRLLLVSLFWSLFLLPFSASLSFEVRSEVTGWKRIQRGTGACWAWLMRKPVLRMEPKVTDELADVLRRASARGEDTAEIAVLMIFEASDGRDAGRILREFSGERPHLLKVVKQKVVKHEDHHRLLIWAKGTPSVVEEAARVSIGELQIVGLAENLAPQWEDEAHTGLFEEPIDLTRAPRVAKALALKFRLQKGPGTADYFEGRRILLTPGDQVLTLTTERGNTATMESELKWILRDLGLRILHTMVLNDRVTFWVYGSRGARIQGLLLPMIETPEIRPGVRDRHVPLQSVGNGDWVFIPGPPPVDTHFDNPLLWLHESLPE